MDQRKIKSGNGTAVVQMSEIAGSRFSPDKVSYFTSDSSYRNIRLREFTPSF